MTSINTQPIPGASGQFKAPTLNIPPLPDNQSGSPQPIEQKQNVMPDLEPKLPPIHNNPVDVAAIQDEAGKSPPAGGPDKTMEDLAQKKLPPRKNALWQEQAEVIAEKQILLENPQITQAELPDAIEKRATALYEEAVTYAREVLSNKTESFDEFNSPMSPNAIEKFRNKQNESKQNSSEAEQENKLSPEQKTALVQEQAEAAIKEKPVLVALTIQTARSLGEAMRARQAMEIPDGKIPDAIKQMDAQIQSAQTILNSNSVASEVRAQAEQLLADAQVNKEAYIHEQALRDKVEKETRSPETKEQRKKRAEKLEKRIKRKRESLTKKLQELYTEGEKSSYYTGKNWRELVNFLQTLPENPKAIVHPEMRKKEFWTLLKKGGKGLIGILLGFLLGMTTSFQQQ